MAEGLPSLVFSQLSSYGLQDESKNVGYAVASLLPPASQSNPWVISSQI